MTAANSKREANHPLHFHKPAIHLPGSQLIKADLDRREHLVLAENLDLLLVYHRSVIAGSGDTLQLDTLSRLQKRFGMLACHKHSLGAVRDEAIPVVVVEAHDRAQTHWVSECRLFGSQLSDLRNRRQQRKDSV